jgi:hypothetical protein
MLWFEAVFRIFHRAVFEVVEAEGAPSDLQPHYGNGVFGNVYLLNLDNTKK